MRLDANLDEIASLDDAVERGGRLGVLSTSRFFIKGRERHFDREGREISRKEAYRRAELDQAAFAHRYPKSEIAKVVERRRALRLSKKLLARVPTPIKVVRRPIAGRTRARRAFRRPTRASARAPDADPEPPQFNGPIRPQRRRSRRPSSGVPP